MTLTKNNCPWILPRSRILVALATGLAVSLTAVSAQVADEDAEINWQALGSLSTPNSDQNQVRILKYPNSDVARVVGPRAFAPTDRGGETLEQNEEQQLRKPIGLESVFNSRPATQTPQPLLTAPEPAKVSNGLAPQIAPSQRLDGPKQTIASAPIEAPVTTSRGARIHFASGNAELTDAAKASLTRLATKLARSSGKVLLLGYGDRVGDSSTSARRLSLRRAVSVRRYLIENGLAKEQIEVRAEGAPGSDKRPSSVEIIQKPG